MATTKQKVERALYGPSIAEVTLGAALSLVLGVVLGAAFLITKPVERVRDLPAEPEARTVYYQEGSSLAGRGQFLRKRQLFLEGSADTITLTEDELNTWIASSRANPDAQQGGGGLLAPQSANFRVRDGVFQIGLPSTFNLFGLERQIILQARGNFLRRGERFVFNPERMYVGSLAAHRVPGLTSFIVNRLLARQDIPAEMATAWSRLNRVQVDGNQLVLSLR